MRKPVTDIALLAYVARRNVNVISYTEATKAVKSSSSASRALHQLIEEGLIEPKPKLIGLRYVTQYAITPRGKQVSQLALQLTQLRESAAKIKREPEERNESAIAEGTREKDAEQEGITGTSLQSKVGSTKIIKKDTASKKKGHSIKKVS